MTTMDQFIETVARLRSPEGGCPWDRKQTIASMSKYLLEEAAEAVDAVEETTEALVEELGDILLVVAMMSRMIEEKHGIGFDAIVTGINEKMIRRHPHVFGDDNIKDADEVLKKWNEIKTDDEEKPLFFEKVSRSLPPLELMYKLQKDASTAGFDWTDKLPVIDKVQEEIEEFLDTVRENDTTGMEEEYGDILFSLVNLARFINVDPSMAARSVNKKFLRRLRYIGKTAKEQGRNFTDLSFSEMDSLWDQAKIAEKEAKS